ncbi:MAG TPA: hypothetical protein VM536_09275 [Chloroflexia bacterium]|nr:hypothetical protein [Chloroflexia bacterium]
MVLGVTHLRLTVGERSRSGAQHIAKRCLGNTTSIGVLLAAMAMVASACTADPTAVPPTAVPVALTVTANAKPPPASAPTAGVPTVLPFPTDLPTPPATDTAVPTATTVSSSTAQPAPISATVPPAATAAPSPVPASPTLVGPTATAPAVPPATAPGVTELAAGFGSPDDVAVDPRDGTIYFGDFANSALNRLPAGGGTPQVVARGIDEPEGIVVLPDGQLIVAEQKTNRLLRVDPATGAKTLVRQLENKTNQDGVDGLGYDPSTGDILIPDSPNGRLLSMPPDGSTLRVLARGFVRPTGAAVLPDGDILVADEFGNALDRVTREGKVTRIATVYQPDDVVVDATGISYVNCLDGRIYRIDPQTGARRVLLSGLKLPHGLALSPDGTLVIAEATRNRIFRLVP